MTIKLNQINKNDLSLEALRKEFEAFALKGSSYPDDGTPLEALSLVAHSFFSQIEGIRLREGEGLKWDTLRFEIEGFFKPVLLWKECVELLKQDIPIEKRIAEISSKRLVCESHLKHLSRNPHYQTHVATIRSAFSNLTAIESQNSCDLSPEMFERELKALAQEYLEKDLETVTSIYPHFLSRGFDLKCSSLSDLERAKMILDKLIQIEIALTGQTPLFSLKESLSSHALSQKNEEKLITTLLYQFFTQQVELIPLQDKNFAFTLFFYQQIALQVPEPALGAILMKLTPYQQLHLLSYALKFYREGSYFLIQAYLKLYPGDRYITGRLIEGLHRKAYDLDFFIQELSKTQVLPELYQKLEACFYFNVSEILKTLFGIRDEQVAHYLPFFHLIGLKDFQIEDATIDLRQVVKLQQERQAYHRILIPYLEGKTDYPWARELLDSFLQGLMPFEWDPELTEELRAALKFDSYREDARFLLEHSYFLFNSGESYLIELMSQHLNAYGRREVYQQGAEKVIFALPTKGKELEKMAWTISLISGLKACRDKLNLAIPTPIVIFDQSDKTLFEKNQIFLRELETESSFPIWHIGREDIVALAKKIGVEAWIETDLNGDFGYHGARNAILHLVPLIKATGANSFRDLLNYPNKEVRALFRDVVLDNQSDFRIHMGDDDLEVPLVNLLDDFYTAHSFAEEYSCREGFQIGRAMNSIEPENLIPHSLDRLALHHQRTQWSLQPRYFGFAGYLGKPDFCLPFSWGCEEDQGLMRVFRTGFRRPFIHLAGQRLPSQNLPTKPYVGLAETLTKNYCFCMPINLFQDVFFDEDAKMDFFEFPWKKETSETTSLRETLEKVFAYENHFIAQMMGNMVEFFSDESALSSQERGISLVNRFFHALEKFDLEKLLDDYRSFSSDADEESLQEIRAFYEMVQEDKTYFLAFVERFASRLKSRIKEVDWVQKLRELPSEEIHTIIQEVLDEIGCPENLSSYPLFATIVQLAQKIPTKKISHEIQKLLQIDS